MKNSHFALLIFALLVAFAASVSAEVFEIVPNTERDYPPGFDTIRDQLVKADPTDFIAAQIGDRVSFNLFGDRVWATTVEDLQPIGSGYYSWTGMLDGETLAGATAVLGPHGKFTLRIENGKSVYEANSDVKNEEGFYILKELDTRIKRETSNVNVYDQYAVSPQDDDDVEDNFDSRKRIDVICLFTQGATAHFGSKEEGKDTCASGIAHTNTYFKNSGVTTRLRLVFTDEVIYYESNHSYDINESLRRFQETMDDTLGEVHALREQYGADLMHLITVDKGCGASFLLRSFKNADQYGYFVTNVFCSKGSGYARQVGYTLGCQGAKKNSSGGSLYRFSYGFISQSRSIATVMARDDCECMTAPLYSNPNKLHTDGLRLGSATADNRKSINKAAYRIANWRQRVAQDWEE